MMTLASHGWHCPRCGCHNHRTIAYCLGCEYPRPEFIV